MNHSVYVCVFILGVLWCVSVMVIVYARGESLSVPREKVTEEVICLIKMGYVGVFFSGPDVLAREW